VAVSPASEVTLTKNGSEYRVGLLEDAEDGKDAPAAGMAAGLLHEQQVPVITIADAMDNAIQYEPLQGFILDQSI
jgi:hypothetical protein